MGLFSGEKIISVDSVVYNMAGDENARPQYLQTLVSKNVLSGSKASIAEDIQNGYTKGPAISFRAFYRWASKVENYGQIGMPLGSLANGNTVSASAVETALEDILTLPADSVWVQEAYLGSPDYGMWAEQWILKNKPDQFNTAWSVSVQNDFFNPGVVTLVITFADSTTQNLTPDNYDKAGRYLYAYYNKKSGTNYEATQLYIYKLFSGTPSLDAMATGTASYGQFFPFIPVRLNNRFLGTDFLPDAFAQCKKAYRKFTGAKIEDLIADISKNPKLGDIDFVFVVPGVSLNVKENASKKYIYQFFQNLQNSQVGGAGSYASWINTYNSEQSIRTTWTTWKQAQDDSSSGLYGTPEPTRPTTQSIPFNEIRITNAGSGTVFTDYDIRLQWWYISNGSGSGLGKSGAKTDELWFEVLPADSVLTDIYSDFGTMPSVFTQINKVRLYWQKSPTLYTWLDIVGAAHLNYIYGDKGIVTIRADQALADTDESGFIVPLHYDTYRAMTLVDATQMATACCYLVFNCYTVKKAKWYENSVFMIIIVVVIAIVSAVFTGGASLGILGTALSVGTAVGLTGMAAIVAGAAINAVVGLIVATLITNIATGVLGDQIGGIVAAVAMMFIGQVSSSIASTGTFSFSSLWGDLMKADTLTSLTNVFGTGMSGMLNGQTQGLGAQMKDFTQQAQAEAQKIQQSYFQEFGSGTSVIDPLMFADNSSAILAESSDTFLTRTLMTGSDIADLSTDLLNNFAEYSLKLQNAFT